MPQTTYPLVKSLLMDLNYLITSNDFANVFSSEPVRSNNMRTYIKARNTRCNHNSTDQCAFSNCLRPRYRGNWIPIKS